MQFEALLGLEDEGMGQLLMLKDLVLKLLGTGANVSVNMPVKLPSDATPTPTHLNPSTVTAKHT